MRSLEGGASLAADASETAERTEHRKADRCDDRISLSDPTPERAAGDATGSHFLQSCQQSSRTRLSVNEYSDRPPDARGWRVGKEGTRSTSQLPQFKDWMPYALSRVPCAHARRRDDLLVAKRVQGLHARRTPRRDGAGRQGDRHQYGGDCDEGGRISAAHAHQHRAHETSRRKGRPETD